MLKKKAVAYMRYSSDNQSDKSIEYQRAAIMDYCAQRDIEIVEEYVDEAFTGTNDRRPAFQRMMADVLKKREWDRVLIYDLSRYFRNIFDAINYKDFLVSHNVKLISVTQEFDDTDEGFLSEMLTHLMNEFQSRKTGKAAHAGMAVKANKAGHCGGIPPLGYDLDENEKLVVNEKEAEAVQKIFDMVEHGYSYSRMAKVLNEDGYRTKSGNLFGKHSFNEILHREKYTGVYIWNKTRQKSGKGHRNSHAEKTVEKQVRIPDGCPQIITKEQFQRVQELLGERARGKATSKSTRHYMLGGLKIMRCAECGSFMIGTSYVSHGKTYTTYACPKHKGGDCPTKDIRTQYVDELVGRMLMCDLRDRKDLDKVSRQMKRNDQCKKLAEKKRGVQKAIANVKKGIEREYSEVLIKRLSQLENELNSLNRAIAANQTDAVGISKENRTEVCKQFGRYLCKVDDPDAKTYLAKMVKEILVSNEEVSVKLNIA